MNIKIIAFGQIIEITGQSTWETNDIKSTGELIQKLSKEYPALQTLSYSVAVNQKIVHADTELVEYDIVALLPPFSGG